MLMCSSHCNKCQTYLDVYLDFYNYTVKSMQGACALAQQQQFEYWLSSVDSFLAAGKTIMDLHVVRIPLGSCQAYLAALD